MLERAFFRTRYIYTPFLWQCFGVLLCLCAPLLERGIFTHLFVLFIFVRLIIIVHGCFTAVTVLHELSRIVAARANLATRLGSSRSVNIRGRYTLAEVHFHYPFSQHDFRWDGRDSCWRFVTGHNYPANRHDPSRSVTLFATRYGSGVLDMSGELLRRLGKRQMCINYCWRLS